MPERIEKAALELTISASGKLGKLVEEIEKLKTEAIFGFVGFMTVVGLVGGGVCWAPAAMGASMLAYRLLDSAANILSPFRRIARRDEQRRQSEERDEERRARQRKRWDEDFERLIRVNDSGLPEEQRTRLADNILIEHDADTQRLRENLGRAEESKSLPPEDVRRRIGE